MQCLYRGPDGLKCAAGCLIPDDKYRPEMEGVHCLYPPIAEAIGDHDSLLVNCLQRVHDFASLTEWPDVLRSVAADHGLNTAVIDELEPAFVEKIR